MRKLLYKRHFNSRDERAKGSSGARTVSCVVLCLLLVGVLAKACTIVVGYEECSRTVQFATVKNGKPVGGVRIAIFEDDGTPVQSFSTKRHGSAAPVTLKPGRYYVLATGPGNLGAKMRLSVSNPAKVGTTALALNLTVQPAKPPTVEESLIIAERKPVEHHLRGFNGVVTDPTGAVIVGASISVYAKGIRDRNRIIEITSNQAGLFSTHLGDGVYTAVFNADGFKEKFITLEVSRAGDEKRVQIPMEVGNIGGCGT